MRAEQEWFVYIIECKDSSLYVGIAKDVELRIQQHKKGIACRFTKFRKPVNLIYEERLESYKKARAREKEIKGYKRIKKLKLINKSVC